MEFHALTPYSTKIIVDTNGVSVYEPVIIGKKVTTYNYRTITGIDADRGLFFTDVTLRTINQVIVFRFFKNEGSAFFNAIQPNLNN